MMRFIGLFYLPFFHMSRELIKKTVGYRAADLIEDGMLVGLGTGSTAHFFIERLIQRHQEGLNVQVIASSENSLRQAQDGHLPLLDIDTVSFLDVTVDGADQIDSKKRMIKGGGGAHVREKIVASMSREMIVIVDESKLVSELGNCKLPVEILPFAPLSTWHSIKKAGYEGVFRLAQDGSKFITDNGNYLIDIPFKHTISSPEQTHLTLLQLPGVVDTGLFLNLAGRIIIGFFDGQIVIRP